MECYFVADIYSEPLIEKIIKLNQEAISYKYQPVDVNKVKQSIVFAKYYHRHQRRKSGEPYYSHPIEVASIAADYIFNTDILVTSILHDTIEDTELTKEIICDNFGNNIADWVDSLSRIKINKKN